MRSFIRKYLAPADLLGEALFGLVMALGFTAAVRLGQEEADNRALFVGILGCNLAWAIVDAVTYVLTAHFERSRLARLARDVRASTDAAEAHRVVREELANRVGELTTPKQLEQLSEWALERIRLDPPGSPALHRSDLLGGVAIALVILMATLPILAPFLVVTDANLAVRLSNVIALLQVFLLGWWWGRVVGHGSLRVALSLTLVGVLLVLITMALGG